ncbi:ABC transporter ATP-binding protein [Ruania zhangjianzhongii]|uniref:ABC transporter ATP-binding protein n=1 Tax=Ruania zhangjianzhongii TaxID=2603206 RepID=UPI0011CC445B|nr:ABC transporter ATP-binding protein [Ruania zhangjianzhongii]
MSTRPEPSETLLPTSQSIDLEQVGISFDNHTWVLRDLDLTIKEGEFFVLVGPSGCGKSTLLKLVAGTHMPTAGTVRAGGEAVRGPGPDRAVVFQSVDSPLMDWRTARGNVEFALRMSGRGRRQARALALEYLDKVGLADAADRYPDQLSGGMKQRVQIARVLAVQPEMILMDEPFAALDAQSRRFLQQELVRLWQQERKTVLYITHDVREAVLLGQRIAVMTAPPESGIKNIFNVDLPYPRDEFDTDFVRIMREVDENISSEVKVLWDRGAV